MADPQNNIEVLNEKLNLLLSKQRDFAQEIQNLYIEIQQLKKANETPVSITQKTEDHAAKTLSTPKADIQSEPPNKEVQKEVAQDLKKPIEAIKNSCNF